MKVHRLNCGTMRPRGAKLVARDLAEDQAERQRHHRQIELAQPSRRIGQQETS